MAQANQQDFKHLHEGAHQLLPVHRLVYTRRTPQFRFFRLFLAVPSDKHERDVLRGQCRRHRRHFLPVQVEIQRRCIRPLTFEQPQSSIDRVRRPKHKAALAREQALDLHGYERLVLND